MTITFPQIFIKDTGTPKGRGVFASKAFAGGEIVEICPVLLIPFPALELPQALKTRVFDWTHLANAVPGMSALALGFGSMYNNANPANMRYEADAAQELLRFIAVEDISIDQELTVNYSGSGGSHVSDDNWWFDRMGLERLD